MNINKLKYKKLLLFIIILILIFLILFFALGNNLGFLSNQFIGDIILIDEDAYGSNVFDSSNIDLIPISDDTVNKNSNNVIYIDFYVGGNEKNNTDNIIYDIALVDLEVDCELLSPYLKWELYKNGEIISNGSLDYKFDTIVDGRLVLTNIQQDLVPYNEDKSTYDYYEFYIWISDSCQNSYLNDCIDSEEQSNLLGRTLSGKIEVELYKNNKQELVRSPSSELNTDTCINN